MVSERKMSYFGEGLRRVHRPFRLLPTRYSNTRRPKTVEFANVR